MKIFEELINRTYKYWDDIYKFENIICYGAGQKGIQTLELLNKKGIYPIGFCDNNINIQGSQVSGLNVYSYKELKKFTKYNILITTTIKYALEIKKELIMQNELNPILFLANPFKAENIFLKAKDIFDRIEDYKSCYNLLSDQKSKEIFIEFLYWKLTGDYSTLIKYTELYDIHEFFDEKEIEWEKGIYLDIGAYTGDSILRFISYSRSKYQHIYAVEPDDNSFIYLQNFINYGRIPEITLIKEACWSKKVEKEWHTVGNNELAYESSNLFRDTNYSISKELGNTDSFTKKIKTETLDNLFYNKIEPQLIKIDALASEVPILYGGENLIRQTKPNIIMEMGTHSQYLLEEILFLSKINRNYKFILRQKESFNNSRTVLYVVK